MITALQASKTAATVRAETMSTEAFDFLEYVGAKIKTQSERGFTHASLTMTGMRDEDRAHIVAELELVGFIVELAHHMGVRTGAAAIGAGLNQHTPSVSWGTPK